MRYMLLYCLLCCLGLTAVAQVGELPRSTPQAEDVNPELLNSFYHDLTSLPGVDVHHLMVMRHGKVIGERHAKPYRATDLHTLYSASKTVTALAVGLAVDDGLLTIEDKVSKHLRDKMPAVLSPALDSLTVRNVLMMAAGRTEDQRIYNSDKDWLSSWFAGEFHAVGKEFNYDSMCTHVLATIVTRLTGKPLLQYVQERIFTPLHITQADWELAPDSIEVGGWGLRLQTESEAKLGQLMLQEGKWNGQQLVSEQWIHDMTQRHISTSKHHDSDLPLGTSILVFLRSIWHTIRSWFTGYNVDDYFLGYGYQTKAIRHPRVDSFFAAGYGGQLIYVVPDLEMVVVVNGRADNYGKELNTIYYRLIDPFIAKRKPQQLEQATAFTIQPPQGDPSHPLESRLFKGTIELEDNLLGLESVKVSADGDHRIFTMTDKRGPLRAVAACGQWLFTTSDERPIYIVECSKQLIGTPRPFTSVAAYAWQGDTLAMRLDWLDGGDNRRMKIILDGNNATVIANDNFDPLLTDTIHGILGTRY